MKIRSTLVRLSEEQAKSIAALENNGLLGKLIDKIRRRPKTPIEVTDIKLFYYPLCTGGGVISFPRAAHLPSRDAVYLGVVDCVFGYAQKMQGRPELETAEPEKSQIVKRRIDDSAAREKLAAFFRKQGYRKYRSIGEVDLREFHLVYKPHYACVCRRGNKEFTRIIDAEIGERDYMLDIKYKDLEFEG